VQQLGRTAQAAGAHPGTRFHQVKGLPATGDQHVAGLFPPGDRTDAKSFGNIGGHVFHAVHCQVDASIQQGFFNLFDEQAFAANFGQGNIQDFVSTGFDDGQFDGDVRMVARMASLTQLACHRASWLPRVPMVTVCRPSVATSGAAGSAATGARRGSGRLAHRLAAAAFADKSAGGHKPADLVGITGGALVRFVAAHHQILEIVTASVAMVLIDGHGRLLLVHNRNKGS
jgi:hypothetical protein